MPLSRWQYQALAEPVITTPGQAPTVDGWKGSDYVPDRRRSLSTAFLLALVATPVLVPLLPIPTTPDNQPSRTRRAVLQDSSTSVLVVPFSPSKFPTTTAYHPSRLRLGILQDTTTTPPRVTAAPTLTPFPSTPQYQPSRSLRGILQDSSTSVLLVPAAAPALTPLPSVWSYQPARSVRGALLDFSTAVLVVPFNPALFPTTPQFQPSRIVPRADFLTSISTLKPVVAFPFVSVDQPSRLPKPAPIGARESASVPFLPVPTPYVSEYFPSRRSSAPLTESVTPPFQRPAFSAFLPFPEVWAYQPFRLRPDLSIALRTTLGRVVNGTFIVIPNGTIPNNDLHVKISAGSDGYFVVGGVESELDYKVFTHQDGFKVSGRS